MDNPANRVAPSLTWFIDLDNTLHDASFGIFPAMHEQMNRYMADILGDGVTPADADKVNATRIAYWKKYGATLLGLIENHRINPADFLQQTHQFDNLAALIRFENGFKKALDKLPGRKILLTNAPRAYAQQVLQYLGLGHYFETIWAIENMVVHGKLRPKPSRILLKKIIAKYHLLPHDCVLIEDTRANLRAAKQLGMKTVWVTQYGALNMPRCPQQRHFIDVQVHSITHILAHIKRLKS